MTPGVNAYTRAHAGELIRQIGDTTLEAVRNVLANGMENGWSIDRIAAELMDSGGFAESRARLIARTESTTVQNESQRAGLESYQEASGNRIMKTWLATQDDRTRDDHLAMDGVTVAVEAEFDTPDLGAVQAPSAPNCRCTLTYELVRGET
jgi:SPP1 gp7 family putative phage head morphogenesis protein